jgi:hypothetical protein
LTNLRKRENFFFIIIAVLFLTAPRAWADNPAKTLKEPETGMEEHLYPSPDKNEKDLLLYVNDRFGYSVKVPHEIFTETAVLPQNGDGIELETKDGKARFRASGGYVVLGDEFASSFELALKTAGGDKNISYQGKGDDYWEICWWNGDLFHRRKFITDGEAWAECEIFYPTSMNEGTEDPLDEISERALQSIELAKS